VSSGSKPTHTRLDTAPSETPSRVLRLDELVPGYQFRMFNQIVIERPRPLVYQALRELLGSEMPLAWLLGTMRGMVGGLRVRLRGNAPARVEAERPFMEQLTRDGSWIELADEPDRELVAGFIGQPWKPDFGWHTPASRAGFVAFHEPAYVKSVTNFFLEDVDGGTRLTTETRVRPTDLEAQRKFATYWRLIGLGASLVMGSMLRAIQRRAMR
jgi:hypothetical protein